jgi:hypothetical protein
MGWLSSLFGSKRNQPADRPRSPAFRPRVEELEDRHLFNVSPAFDSQGHLYRLFVFDNGSMALSGPSGYHVLATSGVRVAHAFRDLRGQIGMDVVYFGGKAYETDSFGRRLVGNNILDLSHSYDAQGNSRMLILYNDGSGFTGNLYQNYNGTFTKLASSVRFATSYVDFAGHFGMAIGTVDARANAEVWTVDSAGIQVLYHGSFVITQSIGDFDEAVSPIGSSIAHHLGTNAIYIDLVFNPGNAGGGSLGSPHTGLEFGPTGLIGWGFNIMSN